MRYRIGITLRITLVFVLFAAALLVVVGYLSYRSGREALVAAATSELLASALEKEARINILALRRERRVAAISASPALLDALQTQAFAPGSASARQALARASSELRAYTQTKPSEFRVLAVADPVTGRIIANTSAGTELQSVADEPFFDDGKRGYHVEEPHLSRFANAPAIVVSSPLRSSSGRLLGVLIGWIDLDDLSNIVGYRSGLHQSDDVYLVNRAFQFVTQPHSTTEPAVLRLETHSEAVQRCLEGNSGVMIGADYHGVPSITVYRWLPRHKLGLITKISQAEASLLARDFRHDLILIGALILLVSSAVAVALARTITRPVHALQQAVVRFGRGEFDVALPRASRDELGQLVREFKRMADAIASKETQLRANATELEQRVRDRTQALQRQADLLDLTHDAIIVVNRESVIEYWNQGAEKMYGWSRQEALGRNLSTLLNTSACMPLSHIRDSLREHGRWEGKLVHRRRDDKPLVVASRQATHYDEHSRSKVALIINSDITEQNQAEEELNRFFDLSLDLLCIASLDGYFKRLNPAWEHTLGYTREELVGRPYHDFVHPDDLDATREQASATAGGEQTHAFECRYRCKDGSYRWLSWQAVPSAETGLLYAVAHDVTERKQVQQDLKRAKEAAEAATRAKSAFLANMSHEIRTPMNGVIGLTYVVLKTKLTEQQREYMHLIKTSADSLLRLLNDILDFSKMEEGKLELDNIAFELRENIGDTLKAFSATANEKGLELTHYVAPDTPGWFVGDPGRLSQIIINLTGNALKFTKEGEVVVRVVHEQLDSGIAQLHFSVLDTGIGISSEQQAYIFNEFAQADTSTTRQYGGTGLGLAIVTQLVELMDGKIWVESEPGRGTTFHFTIRLAVAPEPQTTPVELKPGALKNMEVLVVDDNRTNRMILGEILTSWHMRPTLASGGEPALEELRRARSAGTPFSLVLLDARMPDTDGFQLAEAIRHTPGFAKAIIMMLSSSDSDGELGRCKELGIQRFLRKPIKQSELFDAILVALGIGSKEASRLADGMHAAAAGPTRILNVLVAEDHPINQTLVTEILRTRGHSYALANNGKEVLALLDGGAFDVILMDGQMPEMDGYQATREIRRRERGTGRHIRIIALTANAMKEDRELCLAAGMDDYVSKPIDPDLLLDRLEADDGLAPHAGPVRAAAVAAPPAHGFKTFDLDAALKRTRGKQSLLRQMAQAFLRDLPETLDALDQAVGAGDAQRVERAAHRLKGAASTLNAHAVVEAAQALELHGRGEQFDHMQAVLARLHAHASELGAELTAFIGDEV